MQIPHYADHYFAMTTPAERRFKPEGSLSRPGNGLSDKQILWQFVQQTKQFSEASPITDFYQSNPLIYSTFSLL